MPWLGRRAIDALADVNAALAPMPVLPIPTLMAFAMHNPGFLRLGVWPVSPLVHPRIVRFMEQLPHEHKRGKALFRQRLRRASLPESVAAPAEPENFLMVMEAGLRNFGLPVFDDVLRESLLVDLGCVDPKALAQVKGDAPVEYEPAGEPVEEPLGATTDEQLIGMLVDRARTDGLQLTGGGGLLQQLTQRVLESALEGEITDHVGYGKHDAGGRGSGNSRNGTRAKTVLTDVGPVEVKVPRDVAGTFEPQIVRKRQRRLTGVDEMVLSLSEKGLTHGEISAHLAEVYGAEVSKQTITTFTDKAMEGMAERQSRPLDRVYPVVVVDAIHVKTRTARSPTGPIYLAMAVTVEGHRDILGIWAGDGGEGATHWSTGCRSSPS